MNPLIVRCRTPLTLLMLLVMVVGFTAPTALARNVAPEGARDGSLIPDLDLPQPLLAAPDEVRTVASSGGLVNLSALASSPPTQAQPRQAEVSEDDAPPTTEVAEPTAQPDTEPPPFLAERDASLVVAPPTLAAMPADISLSDVKQGVVTLTVEITPNRFRAGDPITYTYRYRNTNASDFQRGIALDVAWTDFAIEPGRDWQFCDPSPCLVITDSVRGPPVMLEGDIPGGIRVTVGDLAPGEAGEFSVRIDTLNSILPKAGLAPSRVAGSAILYRDNSQISTSENNADALAVGPIFTISKARFRDTTPEVIYPLETGDFIITIANATGEDAERADAIDATNLVVVDELPQGSMFISPTEYVSPTSTIPISFTFDPVAETVTWNIPLLEVGEAITIPVRFQKLDVNADCPNLRNNSYSVSSDEMPADTQTQSGSNDEAERLVVKGAAAGVRVQAPLVVATIVSSPPLIDPGQTSEVLITARNFYNQDLNNLVLIYDLPTNTRYVTDTAQPSPTGILDTGRITWTFSISAAEDIETPSELAFRLQVRGLEGVGRAGVAQIVATDALPPVPDACLRARTGGPRIRGPAPTELRVTKSTDRGSGNPVFVEQGQIVVYSIKIENMGDIEVTGLEVQDPLPSAQDDSFADFRYEPGTANPPEDLFEEQEQTLIWKDLALSPGQSIELTYQIQVGGEEYTRYCGSVRVIPSQEDVIVTGRVEICLMINPQVEVTKEVNVTSGLPGDQVIFTLSLVNRENETLRLGLLDIPDRFQFVRANPAMNTEYNRPRFNPDTELIEWPVVEVPPGGRLDGSFIARLPQGTDCSGRLVNTAAFSFTSPRTQRTFGVLPIPPVTANVQCIQIGVEYSQRTVGGDVGLGSNFVYDLVIRNRNVVSPTTELTVEHVLPPGFSYITSDPGSDTTETPAQTVDDRTGRTTLTWTGIIIPARGSFILRYVARSGEVVGPRESWMLVSSPDVAARCSQNCRLIQVGEQQINYATNVIDVKALLTLEPSILDPDSCFEEGQEITLTYRLALLTTDSRNTYTNTTIAIIAPIGLRYQGVLTGTDEPEVSASPTGQTVLTWNDVTIPKAPRNGSVQLNFFVAFEVGNVFGDLETRATATSPSAIIPFKERVENPTVSVCIDPGTVPAPLIAKEASPPFVVGGGEIFYQIQFSNVHNQAFTVDVDDQLPQVTGEPNAFTFVGIVTETSDVRISPARPNPQTLRWTNISIPPGSRTNPTIVNIVFKVRVDPEAPVGTYSSTARMTRVEPPPSGTYRTESAAGIEVVSELFPLYLPTVRKTR